MEKNDGGENLCLNCQTYIKENIFNLHEAYCLRNLIKCKKCNQTINKAEQDIHEQEEHSLTNCIYCSEKIEKDKLDSHILNCKLKDRCCNFCGLTFTHNLYSSHIYNCGSRTKPCENCKKNIILRDLEYHIVVCSNEDYEICEGEKCINYQLNDASLLDLSKKNPFNPFNSKEVYKCKTEIKILKEIENIGNTNITNITLIKNETLLNIINQMENECNFESDLMDENDSHSNIQNEKESFRIKLQKAFNSKEEISSDLLKKLNDTSIHSYQHSEISDIIDNKYFNEIIDEIKRQIKKEGTVKERREILFSKLNLPTDEMYHENLVNKDIKSSEIIKFGTYVEPNSILL